MLFSKLAEYFEKLEQTSSRLALIDILAELFNEIASVEISKVIYLIQGRVVPFYEPLEIGMAEKTVAASIAKAYGVDREQVLKEYGKVGDLGIVAQNLTGHPGGRRPIGSQQDKKDSIATLQNDKLTVAEVFNTLREIAQTTGVGTVAKKQALLVGLLQKIDPISVKHLVRIPLGANRLGIGDPTVLDGLAKAKLGERSNRKLLENAYNRISDLGLIAETLFTGGLKAIEKLDVAVGRPIRSQLPERLPDAETILEKMGGAVHVQQKFDGFRVQGHKDGDNIRLFSRNLEETTHMFPEIVAGIKKQVKARSIIFDSEALAFNPVSEEFLPFQETTKRRRKYDISEMAKKLPLKAFVFDVMYANGKSLMDTPLRERIKRMESVIAGDEVLIMQTGEITDKEERIQELFNDALTKGLEGLIIKRPDSKYEAGARNFNWVKLKRHSAGELEDTIDCVILGYIYGRGKRAEFGAGALLVGVYDSKKDEFVTVSKIGTGLTDEEWREIKVKSEKFKVQSKPARVNSLITPSVWVQPKIVIEVLADEITRSPVHTAGKEGSEPGYALRFPRLVKFREADKKAEDSTTVRELMEMYQQQFRK